MRFLNPKTPRSPNHSVIRHTAKMKSERRRGFRGMQTIAETIFETICDCHIDQSLVLTLRAYGRKVQVLDKPVLSKPFCARSIDLVDARSSFEGPSEIDRERLPA